LTGDAGRGCGDASRAPDFFVSRYAITFNDGTSPILTCNEM
jgi:hypothetical protein